MHSSVVFVQPAKFNSLLWLTKGFFLSEKVGKFLDLEPLAVNGSNKCVFPLASAVCSITLLKYSSVAKEVKTRI